MISTTEEMAPIRISSGFMYGYSAVAASGAFLALLAGLAAAADTIDGAAAATVFGAIAAASSSS